MAHLNGRLSHSSEVGGQRGDGVQLFRCELDVRGRGVRAKLVDGLGSDDHRGHGRAGEEPCQRDLVHLHPPLPGEAIDLAGDRDLRLGESRAAVAFVSCDLSVQHLEIGQKPAVQRCVGDDRQPEAHARGGQLRLGAAVQQAVHHLGADRSGDHAPVIGDPQRLGDLPGRVVGQGDVAELPLPDQVVVHGERLLQRSCRVWEVGVVEVDVVGAQPAQALLDLLDDVAARQSRGRVEAPLPGLGGEHDLIPATGEGATEDLLGGLALRSGRRTGAVERRGRAVHVRRVEEVDAEIQRRPDDAVGILGTGATPKVAVPTQTRDTRTPVGPRAEYFIGWVPFSDLRGQAGRAQTYRARWRP